jgi:hypothetical protein
VKDPETNNESRQISELGFKPDINLHQTDSINASKYRFPWARSGVSRSR